MKYFRRGIRLLCGIDEAGRGPLAGPVVAAAVVFDKKVKIRGVDDSKKLPQIERREELYEKIMNQAAAVGIGIVDNGKIDRINILAATLMAAQEALKGLKENPDYIITDFLKIKRAPAPVEFFAGGDSKSHAIGAASIIAKVTRDRIMIAEHEKYPYYNFARNKGYGTPEHLIALQKYGPCPIHRLTFNGVTNQTFL